MESEKENIISLLLQLNKSLVQVIKLEKFIAGELQKWSQTKEESNDNISNE